MTGGGGGRKKGGTGGAGGGGFADHCILECGPGHPRCGFKEWSRVLNGKPKGSRPHDPRGLRGAQPAVRHPSSPNKPQHTHYCYNQTQVASTGAGHINAR
eukprot:9360860-Pyramimonas_sp.AAC.1